MNVFEKEGNVGSCGRGNGVCVFVYNVLNKEEEKLVVKRWVPLSTSYFCVLLILCAPQARLGCLLGGGMVPWGRKAAGLLQMEGLVM